MGFAGSKLDDFARSATRDRTPRADLGLYLDHDLIRIEEHRIDREAHEGGVDAPAGTQHHSFACAEVLATEKSAHSAMCPIGHDDALADDPTVLPAERQ
jgi:hypothetical protein